MQGECAVGFNPKLKRRSFAISYQCLGERFRPYRVFLRSQYALGGVIGQPVGGMHTYFSSEGRYAWQKAWETSPCLGMHPYLAAMAMRRRSSSWVRTGAKQSCFVHIFVSKFPKATMRYFARSGFPLPSFLITEMAMVGMVVILVCRFRFIYSSSVMTVQV